MKKRERLKVLYVIVTDKATYTAYNTQTTTYDAVNIEIEEENENRSFFKWYMTKRIILEKKLFEDSWGALCGDSFSRLVHNSIDFLEEYIKDKNEIIITSTTKR